MNFHSNTDVRECDDVREELQPYILTQYSGSPTIVQLLSDFRDNIDPQADINLFIEKVMNIPVIKEKFVNVSIPLEATERFEDDI